MNSFFYALIVLVFLWIPPTASGQIVSSAFSEIWQLPELYHATSSDAKSFELDVWKPYGVSNILVLDAIISKWHNKSLRRCRYSFQGMPGYRKHSLSGEFALPFTSNVLVSQSLEIGLIESWGNNPSSFVVASQNLILLTMNDHQELVFKLDNWTSLIWPESPYIPHCDIRFIFSQEVSEQINLHAAFRFLSGAKIQLLNAVSYQSTENHELFLSFSVAPFELGLGYSFRFNGLIFKLLLEHSPIFGLSPYSAFKWNL